jgi:predicted amidophosphoribosyltransferase
MARLATHAVRRLRAAGWRDADIIQPIQALPRADSASLDAAGRALAAENSLRIRRSRIGVSRRLTTMRGTLVVVDDIVTTGATLAAIAARLREVNVQVTGAAVLAATRRHKTPPGEFAASGPAGHARPDHHLDGSPNEG